MKHCYRCGECKDDYRFRPDQPYWCRWCIRCERSPVGNFPLPETKEDVWHDSDEVSRHNLRKLQIPSNEMLQK
ncbi:protein ninD [Salmonella enterica]|nr:protein ninD [Salmonella enterica]EBO4116931.1 protein ninD [Salmonella enterica]EGX5453297.1 protein ninD [Salmonella enterica]EMD2191980.1 protein ninD [Salmonella enterica]